MLLYKEFFISFLGCSLQIYKNTIDYCVLILYFAALLNLIISSNSCFLNGFPLVFCIPRIMSPVNKFYFFSSLNAFYFVFLSALAKPFSPLLKRSVKSRYSCLVSGLGRKAFFLPLLTMILAVGFS